MIGFKHNGITIAVEDWNPWKKLPVLTVRFDGENAVYKTATFKDKETADWFCEILKEFFKGATQNEETTDEG